MGQKQKAPLSPVAKRLKEARRRVGLSQRALGVKAGLDPSVASARINQYERGRHAPHFRVVSKLAAVLRLPEAYFYAADDDLAALLAGYSALPKKDRVKILRSLRSIANNP